MANKKNSIKQFSFSIVLAALLTAFLYCNDISQHETHVDELISQSSVASKKSQADALRFAQEALEYSERNNYHEGIVKAHQQIGYIHIKKYTYMEAFKHAQISYDMSTTDLDRALSLKLMGMSLRAQRKHEKALATLNRALSIMRRLENEKESAPIIHNIGIVYYVEDKYDKALEYYTEAADIMYRHGDKRELAKVYANSSYIYRKWGLYDKALDYCFKSLMINKEIDDSIGISYAYGQLANIYKSYGIYEKALEYNDKALEIIRKDDHLLRIAIALNDRGVIYSNKGEHKKALDTFFESLKIRKKLDKPKRTAFILKNIGAKYSDLKDFSNALKYLNESKKLYQKYGNRDDLVDLNREIASVYLAMGHPAKALPAFLYDYHYFKTTDRKEIISQKLIEISEVYKQLGNFKKAHDYYRQGTELKEKTFNEKFKKQLMQMHMLSEREKKKKDILILNKERDKQQIINASLSVGLLLFLILIGVLNKLYRYKKREHALISLDIDAIIKANQAVSGEIVFSKLFDKLLDILVAHSQAQKVVLLLNNNGTLAVEALLNMKNNRKTFYHSVPRQKTATIVPLRIIDHVARKLKPLLLFNAFTDDRFNDDPYITKNQLKSVYCIPILTQKNLIGIVYLENNEENNAFTAERVEILNILASQAAISLENAKLYENLDKKVLERTIEVEQLNKLKSRFLAIVAHDLKNPLLDMKIHLDTLPKSDETAGHIDQLKRTTEYMYSLLDELLDISVIESGKLNLVFSQQDYNTFIREVCESKQALMQRQNLTLEYEFDPLISSVYLDEKRIIQVLNNLLGNAVKYAPKDSAVTVTTRMGEKQVITSVSDRGPGIAKNEQKEIFTEFKQASISDMNAPEGTGLGLAIVKKIVEEHRGTVGVDSKPGHGARFYFSLPLYFDE